jgi:hypothetical protein
MHRYQELLDLLKSFEADFTKFYVKGNKSAGTRLRKHMNTLKQKAQEVRNEVQSIKKSEDGEE